MLGHQTPLFEMFQIGRIDEWRGKLGMTEIKTTYS